MSKRHHTGWTDRAAQQRERDLRGAMTRLASKTRGCEPFRSASCILCAAKQLLPWESDDWFPYRMTLRPRTRRKVADETVVQTALSEEAPKQGQQHLQEQIH